MNSEDDIQNQRAHPVKSDLSKHPRDW